MNPNVFISPATAAPLTRHPLIEVSYKSMDDRLSRRSFLKNTLRAGAAAWAAGMGLVPGIRAHARRREAMPRRSLGDTGERVGILGLGGAIAVAGDRDRAAKIVARALDLGVSYIDTASQYGPSEANIGRVMRERRNEAFLASKTDDRSRDGTLRQFEQSLRNLQTDYLDLYQLHAIHDRAAFETARRPDGALTALEELREQGAVRYLGITAHKNAALLAELLSEYPFDCVLMSVNAADRHFDSMIKHALPVARDRNMGIIAMKVASYDGRIFRRGGISSMEEALGYTLSNPVSTAIVGISSMRELEENVRIAREFEPFSDETMAELEARTESYSEEASFFKLRW
ncbi:MAG: aldo/keto reductase [Spirochaetaceae bacterium]